MEKVFKENAKLEQYFETSDGVKFFTKNNADAHSKSLKDRKVKCVERSPLTPEGEKSPLPPKGGTLGNKELTPMQAAKKRADAINEMETVKEVEKALEDETAKSVKKAGAERIASIEATDALNSKKSEKVKNS